MTVYALRLEDVHQLIRDTLVERVLPGVESEDARGELHAVIEMLDNLQPRLSWDADELAAALARTRGLAVALGHDEVGTSTGSDGGDLASLRAGRALLGEALSAAYADGGNPDIARVVAEFSTEDVQVEISRGLRPGLPD